MNPNQSEDRSTKVFFIITFLFLIALLVVIFSPLLGPLLFGAILAGTFSGFTLKLETKLKISRQAAASISCLLIVLGIILPSVFVSINLYQELIDLFRNVDNSPNTNPLEDFFFGNGAGAETIRRTFESLNIPMSLTDLKLKLYESLQEASGSVISVLNKSIGNILGFVFDFAITVMTCFALLTQGKELKKYFFALSPLPEIEEELLLERFNQMNYVSLVCNGVGGLIQGVFAGLVFAFVGIDSPFLWTSLMTVLAFIPLLGISIVTLPASLYLFLQDRSVAALITLILTGGVALWTENWFKPKFIGDRIQINSLFVLFCILGGMAAFGLGGVFYGPLIGILFLTTATLYQDRYQ